MTNLEVLKLITDKNKYAWSLEDVIPNDILLNHFLKCEFFEGRYFIDIFRDLQIYLKVQYKTILHISLDNFTFFNFDYLEFSYADKKSSEPSEPYELMYYDQSKKIDLKNFNKTLTK